MARGPHLSELAAEWQALGAKPQHVRRIFLAWAGLAPWEARKGESFPKAVAEALPGIRERLDRLSHALPVRRSASKTQRAVSVAPLGISVVIPVAAYPVSVSR